MLSGRSRVLLVVELGSTGARWRAAGRRPGRSSVHRDQPSPPDNHCQVVGRVDRGVIRTAESEIEPSRRSGDNVTGRHAGTDPECAGPQHSVRCPDPVGVQHDDVSGSGNDTIERHGPGGSGSNRRAGLKVIFDTAVTGAVRTRRGNERLGNRRRNGRKVASGENEQQQEHEASSGNHDWAGGSAAEEIGPERDGPRDGAQAIPEADSRDRSCSTALVWICDTRLSVTPTTRPISASVRPSS